MRGEKALLCYLGLVISYRGLYTFLFIAPGGAKIGAEKFCFFFLCLKFMKKVTKNVCACIHLTLCGVIRKRKCYFRHSPGFRLKNKEWCMRLSPHNE